MKIQELTASCLQAIEGVLKNEPLKLDLVDTVSNGVFCSLFANSLLNVDADKRMLYLEHRMKLLSEMVDACVQAVNLLEEKKSATIH